jgi:16S rRNA processing protein RimM
MEPSGWVKIGKIRKPVGTQGFMKVEIDDDFKGAVLETPHIFIKMKGDLIPYFIEDMEDAGDIFHCKLEEIDFPEEASKLNLCEIFLKEENILSDTHRRKVEKFSLSGYRIINAETKNSIGVIMDVHEYPFQLMAVTETDKGVKLIPLSDEIIIEMNNKERFITLSIPDGLLDL